MKGTVAALFVGIIVSFFGSIRWLILLLVFAVFSHLATKAFFGLKEKYRLQEGEKGERKVSNVFYAGIMGIAIAFLNLTNIIGIFPYHHYFELFAISLSVIGADTFASEIGVIDRKVYMITNLKPTTPGINGGISRTGQLAALLGSAIVGVSYGILSIDGFNLLQVLVVIILGFAGCQVDSILGALFENSGKLSKGEVNFLASFFGVALGAIYLFVL